MPYCSARAPHLPCASSSVRLWLAVLSLMASFLLLASSVHAGTYVWKTTDASGNSVYSPAYGGGKTTEVSATTNTNRGYPYTLDARPTPPTYGVIGGTLAYPDAQGNSTSASATGGGSLSAKFTWRPDYAGEPVPAGVIIQRDCSVRTGFSFTTGGTLTYQSNTGLGQNNSGPAANTFSASVTIAGTSYTGAVPAADGSVSAPLCSPTATINETSGAMSTGGGLTQASFFTTYTATAYIPTINLTGTTPDSSGNQNILIGQHCAATLSGIPSGCTVSNYAWSVSGTTFQYWSDTTPATPLGPNPTNPVDTESSYYVGGSGPLNVPSPGWYWNDLKQTTETVFCKATITPPAGQGAAFPITVTKKVTVFRPQWKATGTGGTMQVNSSSPFGNGTDFWLWSGPTTGVAGSHGMSWDATVSPPLNTTFGAGSLLLVQLIIPDVSFTSLNFFHVTSTYTGTLNGQEGLDLTYPYAWTTGAPNYKSNDNPGFNLTQVKALSGHLGDQFDDYLMYFAPGSTQCVPLARFVWSTQGDATISNNNWANYGGGYAGTITPSGTPTRFLESNSFPMWSQIIPANTTF